MPISFNQPEPVNAASAYEVGAFPIRMQAREQLAREQAAAGASGAQANETNFRSRAAAGGLLQGQQQFEEGQRQQREEFQAGLTQQTARDVFQAQHEQAMQVQRAQLGVWANSQDLSNQEQVTYQRLQQSLAAWNDRKRSGGLTDEDYYNGIAQLRTGIDPLKMKIERYKAEQEKAQSEMLTQQARHMAVATKSSEDLMAGDGPMMSVGGLHAQQLGAEVDQEFQQKAAVLGIPAGQLPPQERQNRIIAKAREKNIPVWVRTKVGTWEQEKPPKEERPDLKAELTHKEYLDFYLKVWDMVNKNDLIPQDQKSKAVSDLIGNVGLPGKVDYLARGGNPGAGGGNPGAGGGQQNAGSKQPPPKVDPFPPDNPPTPMLPGFAGYRQTKKMIDDAPNLDAETRKLAGGWADRAWQLIAEAGGLGGMNGRQMEEYDSLNRTINALLETKPKPAAAPAAAPPQTRRPVRTGEGFTSNKFG